MGKTGVGGEGETRWGGAGWHWGVVDGRRNLGKISFTWEFENSITWSL